MPSKREVQVKCPICKKRVQSEDADYPFCSERCRSIDLGKWASGAYVIPAPLDDMDDLLDAAARENDGDSDGE